MKPKTLKRGFFNRVFGIPATGTPVNERCWSLRDGKIEIDLLLAPELSRSGGALRLEGGGLEDRVLVLKGDDGRFHAFKNRCRHMGRRLDPVPGTETVQCCSVSMSTYDYRGEPVYGPVKGPLEVYDVIEKKDGLVVLIR